MRPFYHEGQVPDGDGGTLTLVLNFAAIDIIENFENKSMDKILPQLLSQSAPHNLAAKVVWALLREKHEKLSTDIALGIVYDDKLGPVVGAMMGDMFRRAYNIGEAKGENPPKRRGRSKTS